MTIRQLTKIGFLQEQFQRLQGRRTKPQTLARFRDFPTPDISDLMNRLYTMDPGIKNVVNGESIFAPACTVKVFPGDNLMVHKALINQAAQEHWGSDFCPGIRGS